MIIKLTLNRCSIEFSDSDAKYSASLYWENQKNYILETLNKATERLIELDAQDKKEEK